VCEIHAETHLSPREREREREGRGRRGEGERDVPMIPHSSLPIVYPHLLLQCLKHHFVLELLTFSSTDDFALLNIV
jgi:hypothetical protein